MGNDKTRNTLMLLIGGYLIYLGASIIKDVMGTSVDNIMLLYLASICFIAIGGSMIFVKGKALLAGEYSVNSEEDEVEEPFKEDVTSKESSDVEI